MQGSRAADGSVTKNCEDRFEISKTDSAPGRIMNESKRVMKNLPPEIRRDARAAEIVKMKSLECLPSEKQQRRESQKKKKKRDYKRELPERALSERQRAKPKCAARHEDCDSKA